MVYGKEMVLGQYYKGSSSCANICRYNPTLP